MNDVGVAAAWAAGDRLLVIDVINAHGLIIVQTIWALAPRFHRRETRTEHAADGVALALRLDELAHVLAAAFTPPAAPLYLAMTETLPP